MKLLGADVVFEIGGAAQCFKDVDWDESIDMEDLTSNCSAVYQQRPKQNTRKAKMTATNFLDSVVNANFVALAEVGEVINVTSLTGVAASKFTLYGPFVVTHASLKHNSTASSDQTIEMESTGGAEPVPAGP